VVGVHVAEPVLLLVQVLGAELAAGVPRHVGLQLRVGESLQLPRELPVGLRDASGVESGFERHLRLQPP